MNSRTVAAVSTTNPSSEEVLAQYEIMGATEVDEIVKQARLALEDWKSTSIDKRAEFMHNFALELRGNKTNLARTCTREMGKPIKESLSEVEKCAWAIEYYGDNGPIFLNDEALNTDARKTIITFQPLGVIGSIMPWNFPYWQALRFEIGRASCMERLIIWWVR